MLLGGCMPNFIELARLESCREWGRYGWKEKENNKAS